MITSELIKHWPCGCWYSTSLDDLGEVCLIRAVTCTHCFDLALEQLDKLTIDKRSQLTLDLPSSHGAAQTESAINERGAK